VTASGSNGARLLSSKICRGGGTCSMEARRHRWATDHGANVINQTLAVASACTTVSRRPSTSLAHQVVVVAGAGNDDTDEPVRPGSCERVLAVAAVTGADERADFSNFGAWVDLAAPGVNILSLTNTGGYQRKSGTSMAAPHVSAWWRGSRRVAGHSPPRRWSSGSPARLTQLPGRAPPGSTGGLIPSARAARSQRRRAVSRQPSAISYQLSAGGCW
jgi:hypothetical protein